MWKSLSNMIKRSGLLKLEDSTAFLQKYTPADNSRGTLFLYEHDTAAETAPAHTAPGTATTAATAATAASACS
jgi:hypothetical protein